MYFHIKRKRRFHQNVPYQQDNSTLDCRNTFLNNFYTFLHSRYKIEVGDIGLYCVLKLAVALAALVSEITSASGSAASS
jgi:hypothetical protein